MGEEKELKGQMALRGENVGFTERECVDLVTFYLGKLGSEAWPSRVNKEMH